MFPASRYTVGYIAATEASRLNPSVNLSRVLPQRGLGALGYLSFLFLSSAHSVHVSVVSAPHFRSEGCSVLQLNSFVTV